MIINTLKRASKRESRIIYENPEDKVAGSVLERIDPTKAKGLDYTSTDGQSKGSTSSPCTGGTNNKLYRYCYMKKYLKSSGIKYVYYLGPKYTAEQVIQKKMGNCCDLTRLAGHLLISTGLPSGTAGYPISSIRYARGTITYQGVDYNHAWLEYQTGTAQSSQDVITATGQDTCGRSAWASPTTHSWVNQCASPTCRKKGTLEHGCKGADEITCCTKNGGCGADYCIVDGWCKAGNFPYRLTPANQDVVVWETFDPTSFITTGSTKLLGTKKGSVTYTNSSGNPC